MLQYTIEGGNTSCCGRLGADIEASSCDAPTISVLKSSPAAAKAVGQPAWTETRGGMYMALPRTVCMAGWFKALQRAVNLYADKNKAVSPIQVDARIGPETLAAVQQIATLEGDTPPKNVDELAMNHYTWTVTISDFAGVPINADPEPKPSPREMQQIVDDETGKKTGIDTGKGWLASNWKWLVLAAMGAGAAGLGYSIYRTRKQQRAGRLPSRAARGI